MLKGRVECDCKGLLFYKFHFARDEIFSQGYTVETTLNEFHFRLANRYEFILGGLDGMTSRKVSFIDVYKQNDRMLKSKIFLIFPLMSQPHIF